MRILQLFAVFTLLHMTGWLAAHYYSQQHPRQILVVVDTSYVMKPNFPEIEQWIQDFQKSMRYENIQIGTDKAMLGPLDELKSFNVIFRTTFGRMSLENLSIYQQIEADNKILLSDGSIQPAGWRVVSF